MSIVVEQLQEEISEDETFVEVGEEISLEEETLDDLESEIQVPDKFKGKELTDVIGSYTELEKELGRKNNEVGELRRLTDDFLKQQLNPTEATKRENIDLDNLLENPNDVITQAVDDNPRIAALEKQLQDAKVESARNEFESKHTDWQSTIGSEDFQKWVSDSPIRKSMYSQADSGYDYAMADELLNLYTDIRTASKEVAETNAATKRKKALRNTSGQKGSTGEVNKKVFKRADLIRLKQTDPSRYNSMQDEIMLAYAEKRVR